MAPSKKEQRATERRVRRTREQIERDYAWVLALAQEDETGSLNQFFDWVTRKYVENARRDVPLDQPFTQAELDKEFDNTAWRQQYTSFEAEARKQQADPRLRTDWLASIETNKATIRNLADQYGIELSDEEITDFATQARLQNWDQLKLRNALEPLLERTLLQGPTRMGAAGNVEMELSNWARRNGLELSREAIARYVRDVTVGRQTLDSVQDDIRRTYLAGMFPAWSDRINQGFDPSVLFEPYRNAAARLLEVDEIDLNDPLLKRATQHLGDDGKPIQMPLYQFEEQVRRDSRWQYTDNAYSTYTDVGTDLLRMFGFR